jgi:hypothetical protein
MCTHFMLPSKMGTRSCICPHANGEFGAQLDLFLVSQKEVGQKLMGILKQV